MEVDDYIRDVIAKGDKGSALLAARTAPTLQNNEFVDVIESGATRMAILRVPKDHYGAVLSAGGNPRELDLGMHAETLVEKLVSRAEIIGARPLGFANVIDSSTGEASMLETVAEALVRKANQHGIAILNGENAILGARVNCDANVSGTMIGIIPKRNSNTGSFTRDGFNYTIFDPAGKAVFINSDGVGTKTEFYERAGTYELAVNDFLAMNLDDASKRGAVPMVVSGVLETSGNIPFETIRRHASSLEAKLRYFFGIPVILEREDVGDRLRGYADRQPTYNLSGSVVSVIDEERLRNPLVPNAGNHVIAARGKPNPRSNGITDKRRIMIELFGNNWHEIPIGKEFLQFLAEPSTILYPVFDRLISMGLATSVYHMSGGAYNGKLAKPLSEQGLFVRLENLFSPDWRELTLAGADFTSAEAAYTKWPMGNDGFVTTPDPNSTMAVIRDHGLQAKYVGRLEKAVNGKTGVELVTSNGKVVHFPGK